METNSLKCPTCGQAVQQQDSVWTCREHGDWMLYGNYLLVRQPSNEALRRERVEMPWERRLLLAA